MQDQAPKAVISISVNIGNRIKDATRSKLWIQRGSSKSIFAPRWCVHTVRGVFVHVEDTWRHLALLFDYIFMVSTLFKRHTIYLSTIPCLRDISCNTCRVIVHISVIIWSPFVMFSLLVSMSLIVSHARARLRARFDDEGTPPRLAWHPGVSGRPLHHPPLHLHSHVWGEVDLVVWEGRDFSSVGRDFKTVKSKNLRFWRIGHLQIVAGYS